MQVFINTEPSWCFGCKLYEPSLKEAEPLLAPIADLIYLEDFKLLEAPGVIPWTYIRGNHPACELNFVGPMTADELIIRVMAVQRCERELQ